MSFFRNLLKATWETFKTEPGVSQDEVAKLNPMYDNLLKNIGMLETITKNNLKNPKMAWNQVLELIKGDIDAFQEKYFGEGPKWYEVWKPSKEEPTPTIVAFNKLVIKRLKNEMFPSNEKDEIDYLVIEQKSKIVSAKESEKVAPPKDRSSSSPATKPNPKTESPVTQKPASSVPTPPPLSIVPTVSTQPTTQPPKRDSKKRKKEGVEPVPHPETNSKVPATGMGIGDINSLLTKRMSERFQTMQNVPSPEREGGSNSDWESSPVARPKAVKQAISVSLSISSTASSSSNSTQITITGVTQNTVQAGPRYPARTTRNKSPTYTSPKPHGAPPQASVSELMGKGGFMPGRAKPKSPAKGEPAKLNEWQQRRLDIRQKAERNAVDEGTRFRK